MRHHRAFSFLLAFTLVGVACKKSGANPAPAEHPSTTLPHTTNAQPAGSGTTPTDTTPPPAPEPTASLASINSDINALTAPQKKQFDALEQRLQSPCGKAQSLKIATSDPSCKRASFAEKYLARLVSLDLSDDEVSDQYAKRYGQSDAHTFNLKDSAFLGSPNAPVQIVEFFDYGCPHCRDKAPIIEQLAEKYPHDVVVFYKHFPLSFHTDSKNCAIASIAAQHQGKFMEMHHKLFASQGNQSKEELLKYAKDLGLDMTKFLADFNDPNVAARVDADRSDGEKNKIQGTPTIYVNGREFSDPVTLDDLGDWVSEELAVKK